MDFTFSIEENLPCIAHLGKRVSRLSPRPLESGSKVGFPTFLILLGCVPLFLGFSSIFSCFCLPICLLFCFLFSPPFFSISMLFCLPFCLLKFAFLFSPPFLCFCFLFRVRFLACPTAFHKANFPSELAVRSPLRSLFIVVLQSPLRCRALTDKALPVRFAVA